MYRLLMLIALFALVAASCGDDDVAAPVTTAVPTTAAPATAGASPPTTAVPTTAAPPTTAAQKLFPVTVSALNGDVTIDERPVRIVSISPTATEMLFAMGAGGQVAAVDDLSNFPAEAPVTGLSAFNPSLEAIAAFDVDLVVLSFDPGDLVAGLAALGIPSLLQPGAASLDDAYAQLEQLGVATGNVAGAAGVVAAMQMGIAEIVAGLPVTATALTYYHELDDTFFSATSSTFIGEVYAVLGLENIADAADEGGFGFPQLSSEYIIEQDPDLIFLADIKCCAQDATTVGDRPGWSALTALTTGGVVELDDDIASRWGPRIVDYLKVVADAVATLSPVS